MNYDTLIQRRQFEPCQFADLGQSNQHFHWSDVAWSIAGFAGCLIPTVALVLVAALIGYYGQDIVWLVRWVLS